MIHNEVTFKPLNISQFKQQAARWAEGQEVSCILDNNQYPTTYHRFECLVAAGAVNQFFCDSGNVWEELKLFYEQNKGWLFGFFAYDLKNRFTPAGRHIEKRVSGHFDGIRIPEVHFFSPRYLMEVRGDQVIFRLHQQDAEKVFKEITAISLVGQGKEKKSGKLSLQSRLPKNEYLANVRAIQQHIAEGDVYELNYCQEYFAENALVNPLEVYLHLNTVSRAPFACYYRLRDKYLMCASPERFLKKTGNQLISQPIKGTIRRGGDTREDEQLKQQLKYDEKERAENVMIVDLVRNDLAKNSVPGSVLVNELFGIYTFEQVHQMISTVASELKTGVHFIDAIRDAFPMGSMTGAPKIMAMKLIEQYEKTKRGLYSGSVGYITPEGDFDFNVVIRSILYHASTRYLSFQVGGAIVYDSVPEKEYDECLLKAKGMMSVL